ncbi:hypothetical protein ACSYDW_10725 [Paeniglutamicibacter sp. R2-26]|uniref:hypothetical protein n=1 Tax=Paeniglutamicibacter sp. R2-26 TaxID=3144417 RepID=UPI003EE47423
MALDLTPVTGGKRRQLQLALRMAWRDIKRHKGRSVLIAALIALPIFGMAFAATVGFSMIPTPAEIVSRELGQTQGRLSSMQVANGAARQSPAGDLGTRFFTGEQDPDFTPAAPASMAPAGFETIGWKSVELTAKVGNANIVLPTVISDVLHPAFTGKYVLLDGHAPATTEQALVSPGLLKRFDLRSGDVIDTSAGKFAITGTLRDSARDDSETRIYLNERQLPPGKPVQADSEDLYLVGSAPLTWQDAKKFNAQGIQVTSRSLLLDPPSAAEIGPHVDETGIGSGFDQVLNFAVPGAIIGVLALLEVGLLAGAAFAVGARKQQRDLALLAASGAETSLLRNTVTAGGLWLGLFGSVLGAGMGVVGGTVLVTIMKSRGDSSFAGVHIFWPVICGLVLVGLLSAVIAALVPARAVAKQATLAALKSGRTAEVGSKRTPRVGLLLLLLSVVSLTAGVAVSLVQGRSAEASEWLLVAMGLVAAGTILLIGGLVCLTGKIVTLLTAKSSWLPVPFRLAARDSERNRSRTVPAIAAVLAAASLSGALIVLTSSLMQQGSDLHQWRFNLNQAGIALEKTQSTEIQFGPDSSTLTALKAVSIDPEPVASAVQQIFGPEVKQQIIAGTPSSSACRVNEFKAEQDGRDPADVQCLSWMLQEPTENRCAMGEDFRPKDLNDWRCSGPMSHGYEHDLLPALVVGGEPELTALLGRAPSAAALKTLKDGGVVVTNRVFLTDAKSASLVVYDRNEPWRSGTGNGFQEDSAYLRTQYSPITTHALHAVLEEPERPLDFYGVVSADTAAKVQMPVVDRTLLLTAPQAPTQKQYDTFASALVALTGEAYYSQFETGPATNVTSILWLIVAGAALITLSAAGITTGLALADGRIDHATLAGIGADTRLRKAMSGAQTVMTASLGTLLGLFAGTLPMIIMLSAQAGMPVVIPWSQLAVLLIVVPCVGAVVAWVFTRGNVPLTRRQTLA